MAKRKLAYTSFQATPGLIAQLSTVTGRLENRHVIEIESNPHLTVKYGFNTSDALERVREIVRGFGPLHVRLETVDYFPATRNRPSEVLKVSCSGGRLHELNSVLTRVPHMASFGVYKPHITLAYMRPGTARFYRTAELYGKVWNVDTLVFHDADKNKIEIPLIEA